ncbi:NAD-dependent malic enzyme [Paenibacillus sp. 1011MAR3C5]|uniref:NAD-dependent malic enzyme n=1 Tax=Paenibacillus sp. 1011MAR3C5 TaxID=1675787 RepID=UPI000E6CC4AA|nr:NAD-dependent malic enzyme [Paenibacillus sp. 1011MAR3C5]RJE88859.1 NAD-dependent malic enzyme [Paenibacillus sp. 1011MAR3C5]
MQSQMTDGKTIILRLEIDTEKAQFGKAATAIEQAKGDIVAIDVIHTDKNKSVRDLTVKITEQGASERLTEALRSVPGIRLLHISDRTFLLHLGGKITIQPKTPIQNRDDLSRVYTPDVARVCQAIHEEPSKAHTLTIKRNTVAVVSDGSAVLGLGNIGPYAAMPVMEGKAMLFKQFADVDAFPICLDTQDTEEVIAAVKHLAPGFGGINLEDISAPRCFEIEQRLREELDIPVFHDDQHGTAVVLYAGLLNALKLTGRTLSEARIVVCGIGAAGTACTKMLLAGGARNVIGIDRPGILSADETYDHPMWQWYAQNTNPERRKGGLKEALEGADVFIGVSAGRLLTREHVASMAPDPIVFAMANPEPEIRPELIEDIVGVIATGRSDYPNQINNVLCFPGIFRGALDSRASEINEPMKLAAAEAIASVISDEELNRMYIIPSVFNTKIVEEVRRRVVAAAQQSGVSRRQLRD